MKIKDKQYRANPASIRAMTDGEGEKKLELSGYFAVFNDPTELWDGVYEQIAPEAFNKTLDADIRALYDHDTAKVLGRTKNGTLSLKTDKHGLYGTITLNPDDTDAVNLYRRVERGDIDQCSFGFYINEETSEKRDDGTDLLTVNDVTLLEVSVVTFPAYANTSISARKRNYEQSKTENLNRWKSLMQSKVTKGQNNA